MRGGSSVVLGGQTLTLSVPCEQRRHQGGGPPELLDRLDVVRRRCDRADGLRSNLPIVRLVPPLTEANELKDAVITEPRADELLDGLDAFLAEY